MFSDGVGLAMRRLAIIDLKTRPAADSQSAIAPPGSFSTARSTTIAKLREQLEKLGHKFYTNSDTEAIVHAYDQYGADCPKHLRGMFAFAIWDEREAGIVSGARSRRQETAAVRADS